MGACAVHVNAKLNTLAHLYKNCTCASLITCTYVNRRMCTGYINGAYVKKKKKKKKKKQRTVISRVIIQQKAGALWVAQASVIRQDLIGM